MSCNKLNLFLFKAHWRRFARMQAIAWRSFKATCIFNCWRRRLSGAGDSPKADKHFVAHGTSEDEDAVILDDNNKQE